MTRSTLPDSHGVTGPYAHPPAGWEAILRNAANRPNLAHLVRNYRASKHPACLNAIMNNCDSNLWLVFYSGRDLPSS